MTSSREVMFLGLIEWEEPDRQTRLLIGDQKSKQILLAFQLRAHVPSEGCLADRFEMNLYIIQHVRFGFDLQAIATERPSIVINELFFTCSMEHKLTEELERTKQDRRSECGQEVAHGLLSGELYSSGRFASPIEQCGSTPHGQEVVYIHGLMHQA